MTDHLSRRDFLGVAAGAAAAALAAPQSARAQDRPNVLFILADDLGYGDLSCYGRPEYKTPVLDELAEQGMKFTSAYAAAPVCTPTRCAFVTGRYPQRFDVGLQEPLTDRSPPVGLPIIPIHAHITGAFNHLGIWGFATAKDSSIVLCDGNKTMQRGTDIGFFVIHVPIPLIPHFLLPIWNTLTGSKSEFGVNAVRLKAEFIH